MGIIKVLDEFTANQIAAGEVVERPASVVKELVENAIDAGSTVIQVDIQDGGIKSIIIKDNGRGLAKDDAVLAFQRHATSKINVAADLTMISTLGFRGEALPSIAAVAEVEITTKTGDGIAGTQLIVKGSEVIQHRETGCPAGTTVKVTELFYNTPARLKHMKSATVEGGHCGDVVTRLALSHPAISFRFRHNRRDVFQTTGRGDLRDTIAALFGTELIRDMLPVAARDKAVAFQGYLGKPAVSRSNRYHQYIFINGRYIRSRLISDAVEKGYHTMLMTGRRPVLVLAFEIDPFLVDVNIHPTKLEVKFQEEKALADIVTGSVRDALLQQTLIQQEVPVLATKDCDTGKKVRTDEIDPYVQNRFEFRRRMEDPPGAGTVIRQEKTPAESQAVREVAGGYRPEESDLVAFPDLYPLGQIDHTYIVAGGDEGLYLVDQHAAHERILYEKLFGCCGNKDFIQLLLLPVTLEMVHHEAQHLLANIVTFTELGFLIEHFGGDTFLLRGVPDVIKKGEEKRIFLDLLDYFSLYQHKITGKELREHLIINMACKAAIKANQRLTAEEITALLTELAATNAPFTCPHGRPTVIHMTNYELQKKFKRVL